jgi:hypothetical protein
VPCSWLPGGRQQAGSRTRLAEAGFCTAFKLYHRLFFSLHQNLHTTLLRPPIVVPMFVNGHCAPQYRPSYTTARNAYDMWMLQGSRAWSRWGVVHRFYVLLACRKFWFLCVLLAGKALCLYACMLNCAGDRYNKQQTLAIKTLLSRRSPDIDKFETLLSVDSKARIAHTIYLRIRIRRRAPLDPH